MEDIKKAIEEEANRYTAFNIDSEYSHFKLLSVQAQDDVFDAVESAVTHGANFILSKWEESERWRKVEEELPMLTENKDESYCILLKNEINGKIELFQLEEESDFHYIKKYFTHWKPIY